MQWHDETQGQVFTNQTALKNMLRVLGFYFVDMWLPLMSHGILRNLIWLKKKDSQMKNIYFMFICSQRRDNILRCNLEFGHIGHFGLLKGIKISFFLLVEVLRMMWQDAVSLPPMSLVHRRSLTFLRIQSHELGVEVAS